jgi:hypothetical protein
VAQVDAATRVDVDHLLHWAAVAWDELVTVEQEIDSWEQIEQIVYLEEWPIEEDRLRRLDRHARAGDLSDEQRVRYRDLLKLVAERRPIIERLLRS